MAYNAVEFLQELFTSDIGPDDLPGDWRCEWEERAAVMEYDGCMLRERAEALALSEILQQMQEQRRI